MTSFAITEFKQAVERHWHHHAPCHHLLWLENGEGDHFQAEVAPVYQEVVGGEQDGMTVWSGFRFDLSGFLAERGVLTEGVMAASYCTQCAETRSLDLRGTYLGRPFKLRLHLEPIPGTPPVEVIDTIKQQVRDIKEKQP